MGQIELLAPAGSLEGIFNGINAGADAVYFGGSQFSARAFATNLDEKQIEEGISYAHERGKKLYCTVNTMVLEREKNQVMEFVHFLYQSGIDGLIVADVGLSQWILSQYPGLPVHGSTQMAVHNIEGAKLAKKLGMSRVVLARELSTRQIQAIAAASGIEIEVFVHGALCSSVSGACLMSSYLGMRSGNRGKCAQPCRKLYELAGKKGYWLSTADLCAIEHLRELMQAGVHSLKIEGRMKRPQYVWVVVRQYQKALAYLQGEADFDGEKALWELKKIYNRGGFTQGYLLGSADVTYPKSQNHTGVWIGTVAQVKKNGRGLIKTDHPLEKGDGIQIHSSANGIDTSGEKGQDTAAQTGKTLEYADAAAGGYWVLLPQGAQAGDKVHLTSDKSQLEEAKEQGARPLQNREIHFALTLKEGAPPRLQAVCYHREKDKTASWQAQCGKQLGQVLVAGQEPLQRAERPLQTGRLEESLKKTGATPFIAAHIDIEMMGQPFISISQLNLMRRQALEQMSTVLKKQMYHQARSCKRTPLCELKEMHRAPQIRKAGLTITAQVRTQQQLQAAWEAEVPVEILPLTFSPAAFEKLAQKAAGRRLGLALPPFMDDMDLQLVWQLLQQHKGLFDRITVGNLGQIPLAQQYGREVAGDYFVNCANRASQQVWRALGLSKVCSSPELSRWELMDMKTGDPYPIYGHLPLMNLRHCPVKKALHTCERHKDERERLCRKWGLADEKGGNFPVQSIQMAHCLVQVLAGRPWGIENLKELENTGVGEGKCYFTIENKQMVNNILTEFKNAQKQKRNAALQGIIGGIKLTTGHFYRKQPL